MTKSPALAVISSLLITLCAWGEKPLTPRETEIANRIFADLAGMGRELIQEYHIEAHALRKELRQALNDSAEARKADPEDDSFERCLNTAIRVSGTGTIARLGKQYKEAVLTGKQMRNFELRTPEEREGFRLAIVACAKHIKRTSPSQAKAGHKATASIQK